MIQRIVAGEFVDFLDLPPAKARLPAFRDNQLPALTLLQLQETERHKSLIPDYITWSECFAIYTAVLQPQRMPELISYQYEINTFAKRYTWPFWVVYDMNYRDKAANKPTLLWAEAVGHREGKIYAQCFSGMDKDPNDTWCRTCQSL